MRLFDRIRDLIAANVNDLLERAENPEVMLKDLLRKIEDEYTAARIEAAKVFAELRVMEDEFASKGDEVALWQSRAEEAMEREEEGLARRALERKQIHLKELEGLERRLGETEDAALRIRQSLTAMDEKRKETRSRLSALEARKRAASICEKAVALEQKINDPDGTQRQFANVDKNVLLREAALEEMSGQAGADNLGELFEIVKDADAVEAELAALKARKGQL